MTKEKMEDLLHMITGMMDELEDIRVNSRKVDDDYDELEQRIQFMKVNIDGLERDLHYINRRASVANGQGLN
ncbi:hypothetical protein JNUCC74_05855 [Cerasibacillus sp. JNUCC 74]|uniref:hypothetical protein n=1 Tax=Virgibacillus proomii TaxID=84407 RepID=UPI0009869A31|nr:hypothetical protein [Virgibacillus proomii]